MPELPEVETIVRALRHEIVGRRITDFDSRWRSHVSPRFELVRRALRGRRVLALERRAKLIVFHLDDGRALLVHLRMSGRFDWGRAGAPEPRHVRALWSLDDGRRLLFCDARKFGRIMLADDAALATGDLGPEPLDDAFTPAVLAAALRARRRQLKPLLLDQRVIAGLGNIYADESLFYAGLHPLTRSDRLSDGHIRDLFRAIRRVLRHAIDRHGTTIDWIYPSGEMQHHLAVYGRTGEPCRRCRTPIVALRVAQRGTHICPRCQPRRLGRTRGGRRRTRKTGMTIRQR
jgi:formamidopyrimidine-DNA glycosylase